MNLREFVDLLEEKGRLKRITKEVDPVYEVLKGWNTSLNDCKDYDSLPEQTKVFIKYVEDYVGVKVTLISNGPNRSDLIHR